MKELLTLAGLGIVIMLAEMLKLKKWLIFPLALAGLAGCIAFSIVDFNRMESLYGMMRLDSYAQAFNVVMCSVTLLWLALFENYFETKHSLTDQYALIFFALTGALMMVSFTNLTILFLGIEILSISMYVLAGSQKNDRGSNEAAFKYFLMGAFASGFLLFGFALIYGVTGSFDVKTIGLQINDFFLHKANLTILTIGVIMILVGLGFKSSSAPFHFWAPDVYQGSPTAITSFMATVVKTAAFGAFYRLFAICFPSLHHSWADLVSIMIVLTLLIGNLSALSQTDAKRMLAFSSVSNAGYMLFTIISVNSAASQSLIFYAASYSVASLCAFAVLFIVASARNGDSSFASFNGLGRTNPLLAGAMTLSLLSLAGIPPLSGFMAKYFIFANAIHEGDLGLMLFAVVASLVGVYYYFKIIISMYFETPVERGEAIEGNPLQNMVLLIACGILLILGVLPGLVYQGN